MNDREAQLRRLLKPFAARRGRDNLPEKQQ